jgi:N6-L-threonylcarbamoyladenine synthase
MIVLGIETSCDECAISLVEDGKAILSNIIATQVQDHAPFAGVVPEIASRLHVSWIQKVFQQALKAAGRESSAIDAVAVTSKPGLVGSLLVGVSFAKALALGLGKPLVGVDHILAHLYAPQLQFDIEYPFLGLLVSGGHTLITEAQSPLEMDVLGTTIDDAVGEAFDKVAKHLGLGYPGGAVIDKLAQSGDPKAYAFPKPNLYKGHHPFDVSYSGLKTAVINQRDKFSRKDKPSTEDLVASFQKTAVDILLGRLTKAVQHTGITRVVAGGGVAANSYLRRCLESHPDWEVYYPSLDLCTDNGAMIAGLGYHLLKNGQRDGMDLNPSSRVPRFKKNYP